MSYLLILTATIDPKGMGNLKLGDPSERMRQYIEAFRWWLHLEDASIKSILFLENSGADLGSIRELAARENIQAKSVEIIGFDANDYPRELGKGYGEFLMLDLGIAQSKLAASHEYYSKLTGRLGVANLGRIIRQLPPQYDMAADVWPGMIDSRLTFISRDFYRKNITGLYRQMRDSNRRFAEIILLEFMLDHPEASFITCLPVQPAWIGASGTNGQDYGRFSQQLRYPLRQLMRYAKRATGQPSLERLRRRRAVRALGPTASEER